MSRTRNFAAVFSLALLAATSFSASASWQGTFLYYDEEGALVGSWTGGCGAADGRWGVATDNKVFVQGCRDSS
jgi:uncharacterized protein DUF6289